MIAFPFLIIGSFVTWRVVADHGAPRRAAPEWVTEIFEDRWAVYRFMGVISLFMLALAGLRIHPRVRAWLGGATRVPTRRKLTAFVLGATVLVAGLNYGYLARVTRQASFVQQHDSYHYTLGAKYFSATGYEGFYECVLLTEPAARIGKKRKVRDLHTYFNTRAGKLRKKLKASGGCRELFGEERWAAFERDLAVLWENWRGRKRVPASAVADNGYNGTPLHAHLMSRWADAAGELSISTLARMALLDLWGLCTLGFFLCLVFGWRVGMVCAIFMFTNAADRYDIVGGSPGRYLWFVVLGLGVCALGARNWLRGGALLTFSTALVAFPFLFWCGAALSVGAAWLRTTSERALHFVLGCVVASVLTLGLGLAHAKGFGYYRAWAHNMSMHTQGTQSKKLGEGVVTGTPGFGLGLKFVMINAALPEGKGGRKAKVNAYRDIRGSYLALGGFLTLCAAAIATAMRAAAAAVFFGVVAFYALQGTVGYYFVCASLLPICLVAGWRASDARPEATEAVPPISWRGRNNARALAHAPWMCAVLEVLLWGINAYALFGLADTHKRFIMYGTHLSWGLGVWLVLAGVGFAWVAWPRRGAVGDGLTAADPKMPGSAASAASA